MRLADPARSKAILVGTARYDDPALDPIPAVEANVADLAAILTDPELAGFLPENVGTVVNPLHGNAGLEIARWCLEAEDVLLVYFSGHGLVGNDGELLLAMTDTNEALKEFSALPISRLRNAIAGSPAAIRILILDCCYSGRALPSTMAGDDSLLLGQIDVKGTYTLASAPRNLVSLFVPGERNTVFSGELIALLSGGVASPTPLLALSTVHHQLVRRLRERERPTPKVLHTDTVSEFALVRNKGYRRQATVRTEETPAAVRLRTPAEADEFARRLAEEFRLGEYQSLFARARLADELGSAAIDPSWPVLARIRFIWLLSRFGDGDRATAALYALGAAYDPSVLTNIATFLESLEDDESWYLRVEDAWSTSGLVPSRQHAEDFDPTRLWGAAMAMLLATAGLPAAVRIQAVTELAGLGHRDQAVRIAEGMLRERHADPVLVAAVEKFLG